MRRTLIFAVALCFAVSAAYAVTRTRGVSVFDIVEYGQSQPQPFASTAASADLTLAQWRSASYFPISTASAAVDIEVSGTFAASDYGAKKTFVVATGHASQALTVSTDGAGVTTVTLADACAGASCEDVGDTIECWAYAAQAMRCITCCAD